MSKKMLVNAAQEGEVRVGIVEDNVLEDLSVAVEGTQIQKGNLYRGTVVTVESGLQAAFVDYGEGKNGFITFNDIHPRYYNVEFRGKGRRKIQDAVQPGAELLVQVVKEAVGHKGAALTTDITFPGRYLVFTPYSDTTGVSRKIEDEPTRKKLKETISSLDIPQDGGVIVRTAGRDQSSKSLAEDFQRLLRLWGHVQAKYSTAKKPAVVHREPDVIVRTIRDYYKDDVDEIVIDDLAVIERLEKELAPSAPDIVERLKHYRGKMPIFSNFGLERQLAEIASPHVSLPSGGSIVINTTEALTAVDVNSGRSRGQKDQEQMAVETNLEAAVAVARQLRLRDLGGLVVIDFIDMSNPRNRRKVTKTITDSMDKDKARVEIGRISKFGLLELSRQRIKPRLLMSSHLPCPHCDGSGYLLTVEFQAMNVLRRLQELSVSVPRKSQIIGRLQTPLACHLLNEHRQAISSLEERFEVHIVLLPDPEAMGVKDAFEVRSLSEQKQANDRSNKERKQNDRRSRTSGRGGSKERTGDARPKDKAKSNVRSTKAESNVMADAPVVRHEDSAPKDILDTGKTDNATDSSDDASARRAAARERLRARRSQRSRRNRDTEHRSKASAESAGQTDQSSEQSGANPVEIENLKERVRRSARTSLKNAKSSRSSKTPDLNVEPTDDRQPSKKTPAQTSSKMAKSAPEGETSTKLLSRLKGRLKPNEKSEVSSPIEAEDAPKKASASRSSKAKRSTPSKTSVKNLKARLKSKKRDEVEDGSKIQTGGERESAQVAADDSKSRNDQVAVAVNDSGQDSTAKKRASAKLKSKMRSSKKPAGASKQEDVGAKKQPGDVSVTLEAASDQPVAGDSEALSETKSEAKKSTPAKPAKKARKPRSTSRATKSASKSGAEDGAKTLDEGAIEDSKSAKEPIDETAVPKTAAKPRRATRKPKAASASKKEAEGTEVSAAEKPKRTRRTSRKKSTDELLDSEAAVAQPNSASESSSLEAKPTASKRRRTSKAKKAEVDEAITTVEASTSISPEAKPRKKTTTRRRTSAKKTSVDADSPQSTAG